MLTTFEKIQGTPIMPVILILAMNIFSYSLFALDKQRARTGRWRIRESHLLLSAAMLGGLGAFLAMKIHRHKTRQLRFNIVVDLSAVLTLASLWWIIQERL